MKHNIIKIFSTVVLVSALASGCDKLNNFLDEVEDGNVGKGNVTTATFPSKIADVEAQLAGAYSILNENLYYPASSDWMTMTVCSDDSYGGGGPSDYDIQATNHLCYRDINVHEKFWNLYYQGVARALVTIETIDNVDWKGNEPKRNQLLGEAYFLRGYYMYQLTTMFGDIPYPTSTTGEGSTDRMDAVTPESTWCSSPEYAEPVSAEEVIFPQILSDFVSAKTLMSGEKNGHHVNKFVAESMIARAYMFWAGFYKGVGELATGSCPNINLIEQEGCKGVEFGKQDVIDGLNDVINNGGYKLCEDYRSLWSYSNHITWDEVHDGVRHAYQFIADMKRENCWDQPGMGGADMNGGTCTEDLFSISCTNSSSDHANNLVRYMGIRPQKQNWLNYTYPFHSGGYGWAPCSGNLNDDWKFAEGRGGVDPYSDIRRIGSIIIGGDDASELEKYTYGNGGQMEESGLWAKKFSPVGAEPNGKAFCEFSSLLNVSEAYAYSAADLGPGHSPQNVYIIRYADVFLMKTELTGDASLMNQVQARAGVPQTAYSLKAVQDERRWEFAFEGLRWNDMRRWSGCDKHSENSYAAKALNAQNKKYFYNNGVKLTLTHNTCSWAERYVDTKGFRPIPQTEIARSGGVLHQNAGWEDPSKAYFTGYILGGY